MYQLPAALDELIRDEREMASIRFHNACVGNNFDPAAKWEARVKYWDAMADRAVRYKHGTCTSTDRSTGNIARIFPAPT